MLPPSRRKEAADTPSAEGSPPIAEGSPPTAPRPESSWVMLLQEELLSNNNSMTLVTLPDPATRLLRKYCLDRANCKIHEVVVYDEPHRSWFYGDMALSDGRIYFTTPVNPTFLILPRLLEQCSKRAVPLEDLLSEKGFDQILDFIPNLEHVADLKGPVEMKAYKYNEEKTIEWLAARIKKLAKVVRSKNIDVSSGAVSATFITSNRGNESIDEEFYLKYAHGIISGYLKEELAVKVEEHFNFKAEVIESLSNKRKSEVEDNSTKKKVKVEPKEEQKENSMISPNQSSISKLKVEKPLSNKDKARQKAASGTKTISSFFAKK